MPTIPITTEKIAHKARTICVSIGSTSFWSCPARRSAFGYYIVLMFYISWMMGFLSEEDVNTQEDEPMGFRKARRDIDCGKKQGSRPKGGSPESITRISS